MWVETCRERVNPKCPVLQKQSPWRSLCLLWPQLSHEPSTWKLLLCLCMCTCVYMCVHMLVYMDARGQTLVSFLRCLPPCIFEAMVSRWPRAGRFGCLARPILSIHHDLLAMGLQVCHTCFKYVLRIELRSLCCVANVLLTQPCPPPSELLSRLGRDNK